MSANLNMAGDVAAMAFVGETPWHGLGNRLEKGASIDTWREQAGMNFSIKRSRVRFAVPTDADLEMKVWDTQQVLFRSDSQAPLALCSKRYKVVQPAEVLEFFRGLTEKNGMVLDTAGVLGNGEKYWAQALTGDTLNIKGDVLHGRLLLATSCDGSLSTTGKMVSERVVCANTLGIALGEQGDAVRVRHNTTFDAVQVKIDLGVHGVNWMHFTDTVSTLADTKLSKKAALSILIDCMGDREQFTKDVATLKDENQAVALQPNLRGMARVLELFDGKARGADLVSAKGTAWGLVNATTEYLDHEFGRNQSNRLASAWFGVNARLKTGVVDACLELA